MVIIDTVATSRVDWEIQVDDLLEVGRMHLGPEVSLTVTLHGIMAYLRVRIPFRAPDNLAPFPFPKYDRSPRALRGPCEGPARH